MSSAPLVVVGGGPAGMAACIEAARGGLSSTLIDEAPELGGQIYRVRPAGFQHQGHQEDGTQARGDRLRAQVQEQAARIERVSGTEVLGVWNERELLLAPSDAAAEGGGAPGLRLLKAERLILATGAYDRSMAFPGWTLPGVMTAGGAQSFVKTMRVRPGDRALVAGTGPLLLVVANQLLKAGIAVKAVLEAGRFPGPLKVASAAWGNWELLAEAWRYYRGLHKAGVRVLYNHAVFRAEGRDQVRSVEYGPVDQEDWHPLVSRDTRTRGDGRALRVDVDLLVVGYGLVPSTELSVMTGCKHAYREELGGWVPERDSCMRTSTQGVYAVGDGAGVAGALVAVEQGRVAGVTAAQDAGTLSAAEADQRRAAPLAKLARFGRLRALLDKVSRPRPGLLELMEPDTLLCRCEEVSLAAVRQALSEGARDLQAVKLFTRLGMGPCQGRNCAPCAALCMARDLGRSPSDMGRINPRLPVRPVTLGALAGATLGGD